MAARPGWNIIRDFNLPCTFDADTDAKLVCKLSGAGTVAICGAGEVPIGVNPVDREEDEIGEVVTQQVAVCLTAASVTAGNLLTTAANGTVTPVSADQDVVVGRALTTQTTTGGDVSVLLMLGQYYATT